MIPLKDIAERLSLAWARNVKIERKEVMYQGDTHCCRLFFPNSVRVEIEGSNIALIPIYRIRDIKYFTSLSGNNIYYLENVFAHLYNVNPEFTYIPAHQEPFFTLEITRLYLGKVQNEDQLDCLLNFGMISPTDVPFQDFYMTLDVLYIQYVNGEWRENLSLPDTLI